MRIEISEHAMWRAAERFPGFDTVLIEEEVRLALKAGRITTERETLGLAPPSRLHSLYVWTPDGQRIYVLYLHRDNHWVVTTTMRCAADRSVV